MIMGKSSNKSIKDAMVRKYGAKCFIEELGLRSKEEIERDMKGLNKKQRNLMNVLTFHHIKERCVGGRATEENGAILRNVNHIWFNSLSKEEQERLNSLFQEYKKRFRDKSERDHEHDGFAIGVAEINNGRIVHSERIDIAREEADCITIPVYDLEINSEEYDKWIRLKRQRERERWAKLGYTDKDWER